MTSHGAALGASIEIPAGKVMELADIKHLIPAGTRVYLPEIGVDTHDTLVAAARYLSDCGYVAVPHIAARRLKDKAELEERLVALVGGAGTSDVLLIAGDLTKPGGVFSSSMDVLETGLFDKFGVRHVGLAGHPEGVSFKSDAEMVTALRLKAELAERSDARFRIVTQFGFDAPAFIEWAAGLRLHQIDLPVHLGVAGPAKLTTLIKYAALCGVGNSLNFLKKRASAISTLISGFSPDEIVQPIEAHVASDPHSAIAQIHVFPFGGVTATANWLRKRGTWVSQSEPVEQSAARAHMGEHPARYS